MNIYGIFTLIDDDGPPLYALRTLGRDDDGTLRWKYDCISKLYDSLKDALKAYPGAIYIGEIPCGDEPTLEDFPL